MFPRFAQAVLSIFSRFIGLRQWQGQLAESWAEVRDQNTYALAIAALGIAVIGIVADG